MTGCSGLRSDKMAQAFVSRGAREVIAWDDDVAPAFTDIATETLLKYLVRDKRLDLPAIRLRRSNRASWAGGRTSNDPCFITLVAPARRASSDPEFGECGASPVAG